MDNIVIPKEYVLVDAKERELRKNLKRLQEEDDPYEFQRAEKKYLSILEKHRGIYCEGDEKKIDYGFFSKYFLKRCKVYSLGEKPFYAYSKATHCYEEVGERTIKKMARYILDEVDTDFYFERAGREIFKNVQEDMNEWRGRLATPGIIVFRNGTLHLNLDSDQPMWFEENFSSKNVVFHSLPYDYNPEATCPKFQAFLRQCMKGDEELVSLLRDCCANIFSFGEAYVQHLVFFYGSGRNGKSVLCGLLEYLFPEMVSHVGLSRMTRQFGNASMVDAVLNISEEAEKELKDTSLIKEMSAGSTVSVERKGKDITSARMTVKLFATTNSFPKVSDESKGWEDRLTIIPFDQIFEVAPADGQRKEGVLYQNPHMLEELQEEREGIAAWLLEGLEELKERGWVLSDCKRAQEFKLRILLQAQPVRLFFRSCITVADGKRIRTKKLHDAFRAWANRHEVDMGDAYSSKNFHERFRNILRENQLDENPRKIQGNQYYVGISLGDFYFLSINYGVIK